MTRRQFELSEADLHPHLKNRMEQRGVTLAEVELVLNAGQEAASAKPGTIGRIMVIPYEADGKGVFTNRKKLRYTTNCLIMRH
jgi:hypothetical protein